jgi:hypothetical protein
MIQTRAAGRVNGALSLGVAPPGGLVNIHDNSAAVDTVVTTTLPHGLITGDVIYVDNSDSNVVIDGYREVVYVDDYSFTFDPAVDCHLGAGTDATTIQPAITAISVHATAPTVTCGAPHGLRTGDTVTIAGSDSTPAIDNTYTVTVTGERTFTVADATTVVGTEGYFTKDTYSLDVLNRGDAIKGGAVIITSAVGEGATTVDVDVQGSFDQVNWFNVPYALVATPRTFVITTLTITTAVSTTYLLEELVPYRFLRLYCSTSTNTDLSATAYIGE